MFTQYQLSELFAKNRLGNIIHIEHVKQHNHVYALQTNQLHAYLKVYTKDWYGDDILGTGFCVDHEITAWQILQENYLGVPEVILADMTMDNPLRRPFLMTKSLQGQSLIALANEVDPANFKSLLVSVGQYLATMHQITFAYPGYITSRGLNEPPRKDDWQHTIWTFDQFWHEAQQTWAMDCKKFPASFMNDVEVFAKQYNSDLVSAYAVPKFVHGDCHANQFFLYQDGNDWQVSGVLDMEVSSGGDYGADFVKFGLEMAALFPADTFWWEYLFEGYGEEPSFELLKLRMLAAGHHNYSWLWQGSREAILRHIITANTWHNLFDLTRLEN